MSKFYRTTITIELLSEDDNDPHFDIEDAIGDARVVADIKECKVEEVDGPTMAKALSEARSYPGFFDLEDEEE
jgi:hypothetical protein